MNQTATERNTCRISGEPLEELFSFGELHVSDFLQPHEEPRMEPVELKMCLAPKSGLVQLAHTAPLDIMYKQYWYRSGTNQTMTNELKNIAESAQRLMKLEPADVFLDIGCNDGTLLSFVDSDLQRVGFEPSNIHEEADSHTTFIVNDYFNANAYEQLPLGGKKARVITSIAMFYDLEDPHAFIEGIHAVLENDGLWIIQMSYLPLMLEQVAFDNICHEHLEYYSLSSLRYLLNMHGFGIVDVQLNDINGGSFRVYVMKQDADITKFGTAPYRDVAQYRIYSLLNYEERVRLNDPETYRSFYRKATALKEQTIDFITTEKERGKTIWGYGASTKGNTLLQWFGLDNTLIDGIAERQPTKFNLQTVGTNIPIASEEEMHTANPDYLLILPWHFINEFRSRETEYLNSGGKFIVPCPNFEIISTSR